jgi:hypothetical protein
VKLRGCCAQHKTPVCCHRPALREVRFITCTINVEADVAGRYARQQAGLLPYLLKVQ